MITQACRQAFNREDKSHWRPIGAHGQGCVTMYQDEFKDENYINVSSNGTRIDLPEGPTPCYGGQSSRDVANIEHNVLSASWSLWKASQKDGYLFLLVDMSSDNPDYAMVLNETIPKEELQYAAAGIRLLDDAGYIQDEDHKWVDPNLVLCIYKFSQGDEVP